MKVHVREASTGRYYCRRGVWGQERAGALDFENIARASALVNAEGWRGMEIILAYDEPVCELVVPQDPFEYR